jgi:hypothetical protein
MDSLIKPENDNFNFYALRSRRRVFNRRFPFYVIDYKNMYGEVKKQVKTLLSAREHDQLIKLSEKDACYWKEVRFRLYDLNEGIRWAAIETVAGLMRQWWASGKKEQVRNYIRTLFWSLNDESGGIGWSSAQTIAEIIMQIPELADPYASMLIAHTLDEPPLVKGGLWGIGSMGTAALDSVIFFREKVMQMFQSSDDETLGLASWAMGEVGLKEALPYLRLLENDNRTVYIYIGGEFVEKTVGEWASDAVVKISR